MTESPLNDLSKTPLTFNTLGHYEWPVMPTDESLRRFSWQIWKYLENDDKDPFIADDSLKWANKRRLDRIATPPACAPITEEMQQTFAEWVADDQPARWSHLVVLPPGDRNKVLETWANEHGHHVVEPPPRDCLLNRHHEVALPDCKPGRDPNSVLVVPRLERWFLRHQDGLVHVRQLLRQVASAQRHCVIGCNSWAWQFLDKSIHAGRLLPIGLVPNAFDADRLRNWLMNLAEQDGQAEHVFRLSEKGSIVNGDYFAKLTARSLGIPWVAWQLWRRALRVGPGEDQQRQQKFPDERTIWVSKVDDFRLPRHDVNIALLTLHALLIHDSLTAQELDAVTPGVDASNVLPSLAEAELIESEDGKYQCVSAAYPAIRSSLIDAGFPKDNL